MGPCSWQRGGPITLASDTPGQARSQRVLQEVTRPDSTALVRLVADRLRSAITREELAPGTRLNQVRLAEQLGVSRMPIRAAIVELSAEGLIETLPTGGARVRRLTSQDLLDVYDVRTGLEVQAVRHLAEEGSSSRITSIGLSLDHHRPLVAGYDTSQLLDLDCEFHTAILEATGNPYFLKAMRPVWSIVERAMFGILSLSHLAEVAWQEHEAIYAAIQQQRPEQAAELVRAHLQHGAARLVAVLESAAEES